MKHFNLHNGDQFPALGLGTWKSEKGEVYNAIREAITLGYRHFDCALIYGNELEIGQAFQDAIQAGEVTRKELWITSKLWNTHHRQADVVKAIETTLGDLGLDYLDLYLIHWPIAQKIDIAFPTQGEDLISLKEISLEETWSGMEDCFNKGLAKHIGTANFSRKKLAQVNKTAQVKIEVNQVELHPLLAQKELKTYCDQESIILTAYSPLGSRDRADAMKADDEPNLFELPAIITIAEKHNLSPAQILLAWAINRGTTVIPKSTNPARLKQNLEAAEIDLTAAEMDVINSIDQHYRYVHGKFFALPGSDYTVENMWDE
ncbi:MAG: aldo/keto reductase [Reichenbachiella sp.]